MNEWLRKRSHFFYSKLSKKNVSLRVFCRRDDIIIILNDGLSGMQKENPILQILIHNVRVR